jgi:hypothetical protein
MAGARVGNDCRVKGQGLDWNITKKKKKKMKNLIPFLIQICPGLEFPGANLLLPRLQNTVSGD